ncbi:MAG: hypothetical protein Q4D65_10695, partial [Peptostreptococcaceae bacterium]|nr:hypothetical protein [Peptostreptococcaceae bacterium]
MNKKVLSIFLALLLMIPNFAFAENAEASSLKEELGGKIVQEGNEKNAVASTRALQALMYQANGKLQDDDSVEVIVSFRPDAFPNLGQEIPASELYQGDNVSRQQSLGEDIVEEGLRRIENEVGDISTIFEYHVLFFGFSSEITFAQAKAIAQLDYVDFVEIATQRTKPVLKNPLTVMTKDPNQIQLRSALRDPFDVREIVGSPGLYANNKGEGTLIAIIDSG